MDNCLTSLLDTNILLTQGDGPSGKVECEVLCNAQCHLDVESEQCICQKYTDNLFDMRSSKWSSPGDGATIEISKLSQS